MTESEASLPVTRGEMAEIVRVMRDHAMIVIRLAMMRGSDPELEQALTKQWMELDETLKRWSEVERQDEAA